MKHQKIDWKLYLEPEKYPYLNEWPAILGSDAAGVVVSAGKDVSEHKAGDRVFFQVSNIKKTDSDENKSLDSIRFNRSCG